MQLLNLPAGGLPVYLPADTAVVPFGDPLSDATVTSSTAAVVNAPGYNNPQVNDIVAFSSTGALPGGIVGVIGTQGFQALQLYYVNAIVSTAAATFTISTTKGGSSVATTTTGTGVLTLHLMNMQQYGSKVPFKTGATVLAANITTASVTLYGAPDLNVSGQFGNPEGPNTAEKAVIATIASGAMQLVQLGYDWIWGSGTTVLSLLQN